MSKANQPSERRMVQMIFALLSEPQSNLTLQEVLAHISRIKNEQPKESDKNLGD